MSVKRDGVWIKWTYSEYLTSVRCISRAFIKLGLEPRRAVAALGLNSPEWFISDLAAIFCGSVGVGIYPTNSPEATKYVLLHSRASIIVVENDLQLQKVLQIREELKDIKAIIQYTGKSSEAYSWDDVMKIGKEAMDLDIKVDERLSAIGINQCCQLVYTSGTTGPPKAVMLSHDNLAFAARSLRDRFHLRYEGESIVSYLPLSHIAAFIGDIILMISCHGTTYFADKDALKGTLTITLQEVQPTVFFSVPRVFEKIQERLLDVGRSNGCLKKKIGNWAKKEGPGKK